jgi:general secretion pathway protein F
VTSFSYEAINAEGAVLQGRIDASDLRSAQRSLRQRGLTPLALSAAAERLRPAARAARFSRGLTNRDCILAMGELATLVEAGVPLGETLSVLAERNDKPEIVAAFVEMDRRLKRGQSVADALRGGLSMLPAYVYQLVQAGEEVGKLGQSLRYAVTQMEYDDRQRQDMRNALTYPAVLVFAGICAVLFIFTAVIPRFSTMFTGRFSELPWLSQVVFTLGLWVDDHLLATVAAVAALVAVLVMLLRRESVRRRALDVCSGLPIIGAWLTASEMARWGGTMSKLLMNRIPLMRALEMSRGSLKLSSLIEQLSQVERVVRSGSTLSAALTDYTKFDSTSVNLIRVGERAGTLASMLQSLADMHDRNSRDRMKKLLILIEPAAILLIGGFVGVFVTAVILAITSVNQIPI